MSSNGRYHAQVGAAVHRLTDVLGSFVLLLLLLLGKAGMAEVTQLAEVRRRIGPRVDAAEGSFQALMEHHRACRRQTNSVQARWFPEQICCG